jgi:hypothetical protein
MIKTSKPKISIHDATKTMIRDDIISTEVSSIYIFRTHMDAMERRKGKHI